MHATRPALAELGAACVAFGQPDGPADAGSRTPAGPEESVGMLSPGVVVSSDFPSWTCWWEGVVDLRAWQLALLLAPLAA